MSINDKIYDRIVDHMGDVRLYEEGVQIQNRRIIRRHRKNLRSLLSENVRADMRKEVSRFGTEMLAHQTSSLKEFSTSQLDFYADNLYKEVKSFYEVKKPRSRELLTEIAGTNIKGSRSLSKNMKNISSGELVRMQSKVKAGLAAGKSKNEIVNDVLKTTKITEIQAKTLTRTSITKTQAEALTRVVESNKHLIKGYMFTAILDSRTSPICSHHNGKMYDVDDKRFMPPLHWNCRSSLIPVMKSKEELAQEKTPRLKKKELAKKRTDSLTGMAPKKESFGAWLRRQPMSIQNKMLGSEERANLFRQGKLKADQFVSPKGLVLSISALRRRASEMTAIYRPRQKLKDTELTVSGSKPYSLVRSPERKRELQQMFLSDADDFSKTMSLTNYRGTTLVGKQASRRRVGNEFDERNFSQDPFTGEIRNTNLYDPDFGLYQERIDFMRNSKLLSADEKDFIQSVADGLSDKVSVNQQTVIIENLRVVFERYARNKQPWENTAAVIRAENRFAVQNVSRLLDVRSRKKTDTFVGFLTSKDEVPRVSIMNKYYSIDDLQKQQLRDQRFIDAWRRKDGAKLAKKIYFSGRAPLRVYFRKFIDKYPTKEKLIKKLTQNIPFKKEYDAFIKFYNRGPSDSWITQTYSKGRESIRKILDAEFLIASKTPTSKIMDDKALDSITNIVKTVFSGQSTDYDTLAINIGKRLADDFKNIIPFTSHTIKDYHREGSEILDMLVKQKLIRVQYRGKIRRGVLDLDTGRASGGWGDTISREVIVIDKNLLRLQEAERRTVIARRMGVTSSRDRLYVKAGKKTYVNARGQDTGIPIVSRNKFPDYDPKQIDRDMANMLNHVMNVDYEIDPQFFDFMDDVLRFRDPRGKTQFYDNINEFRHDIINRGELGYGLMASAKYHRQRGKPFKTYAYVDSRGRVYHRGYLTPTGGEIARPFLNSAKAERMTPEALRELKIQVGAFIGPGNEALTQAGRLDIFKRNEAKLLELGGLLQATTQRDRRIREFLEHPLIQGLEGKEVPKMARLALEYKRIHDHTAGNVNNVNLLRTYRTKLMIENDASSSGAQIIGLSTGDRQVAIASNVIPTTQKNRLYDLVAMDTINDPEFLKIPALRDANLKWEDLSNAAKGQNMVGFYGAGAATKTMRVTKGLREVLEDKNFLVITKENLNANLRLVDGRIKIAQREGADAVVAQLTSFRKELIEVINNNQPVGRNLLKDAQDIHPDVGDFVNTLTNKRQGLIGPKDFSEISRIMSKNMSKRAPVTDNFINYWKKVSVRYVTETEKVDIPWVTFDGKIMTQRYRPQIQERIEFRDPVSGRLVKNIYETSAEDGRLLGKGSITDARIGLGVNGNHSNDAVLVRKFHLWGRKNNIPTGTIHDAFFTNIGDVEKAKRALRTIYADALEGDTIRKTLKEMRKQGLSRKSYNELLKEAKELGLIDPPNKITRKEILEPDTDFKEWYGIGP